MIVNRRRLLNISNINLTLYTKSWNSAGTYSFTIPSGCTKIEAFLIGGGGGGGAARGNNHSSGSGGDDRVIIRYYAY